MSGTQLLVVFGAVVLTLLVIDLFVVHRRDAEVTLRSAAIWSVVWIGVAVIFGLAVLPFYGDGSAVGDYFGAFLVEKSLSVDNVFLWLVVFTSLGVTKSAQRRVLLFGVLGALILRFGVISAGAVIMESFTWVLWIAGAFLVYAGYKMWRERNEAAGSEAEVDTDSLISRAVRRIVPTTDGFRGDRFVVREGGRLLATPLLLALILVELTDIVMAFDAVPATLAISTDVAVVMSATGFALLGMRALFFLIAGVAERLRYLKVAVAVIMVYIGATLIVENVIQAYHASTAQSLTVIGVVLAAAVYLSLRSPQVVGDGERPGDGAPENSADSVPAPAGDHDGDNVRTHGDQPGTLDEHA